LSFFKDERYEDMDYLTKAVRPILWSPSDKYAQFPDEIEIGIEHIEGHSIRMREILEKFSIEYFDDKEALNDVANWFTLDVEEGTYVDLLDNKLIGSIKLKKTKITVQDSDILQIMNDTWKESSGWQFRPGAGGAKRAREILDLIGVDITNIGKGKKDTLRLLKSSIENLIENNTLKIYNGDLMIRMMNWILNYINIEDLQALANFSKLKVMTHKNEPIYSMKEIV